MPYSKSLSEKRKLKYEAIFEITDNLKPQEGTALAYDSPEEAKCAREALYNHWKITGLIVYREINSIGRDTKKFWVQNTQKLTSISTLSYDLEELTTILLELPEDAQVAILVFLHRSKLLPLHDCAEIEAELVRSKRDHRREVTGREQDATALEVMGAANESEPEPEPTKEELEQMEADFQAEKKRLREVQANMPEELRREVEARTPLQPEPAEEMVKEKLAKTSKQTIKQILKESAAKDPIKPLPEENPISNPEFAEEETR